MIVKRFDKSTAKLRKMLVDPKLKKTRRMKVYAELLRRRQAASTRSR